MKKILLLSICSIVLVSTSSQALKFGAAPHIEIPTRELVQFLPTRNEELEKALQAHNLMTELPALQTMAEQQAKLKSNLKDMQKFFDNLMKCNENRLGRFKNSAEMLKKVRQVYKEKTQNLDSDDAYEEDSIVPRSLADRNAVFSRKKEIEAELMRDVLENGKKWGGESISKKNPAVPENMQEQMIGSGLEELAVAEEGTNNASVAEMDFDNTFNQMQQSFIQKLSAVGLQFPDFNAARSGEVRKVQKALQELKQQHLEAAKEYITKLDEQDLAHPKAVARRTARSQNKQKVLKKVKAEFPEAFAEMQQFDQQTPQQRQRMLVAAMEKDTKGTVYLTETNASEIDQKMAEMKSNRDMVNSLQDQMQKMVDKAPEVQEFDFSLCSV